MREFKWSNVESVGGFLRLYCERSELIDAPTAWQKRGLQETASGYGRRLNSGLKIRFEGRDYRLYVTIFSNVGSTWFTTKGRKIYVD